MEERFDDRAYRRGLVLGLTMAEVVILLIFALLLMWMFGLQNEDDLEQQVTSLIQRVDELVEQRDSLAGSPTEGNRFDDLFRELRLAQQSESRLEEKVAKLEQSDKLLQELGEQAGAADASYERIAEQVRERIRIADGLITAAGASSLSDGSSKTDDELAETIAGLMEVRDGLEAADLHPKEAGTLVSKITDQLRDKDTRIKTMEGRLRNAQRLIAGAGRGTEKPACWAVPETGKTEYIFNVALRSASLIVHDNALPHRHQEQAKLPIQNIRFDKDIGVQEFRKMTRALFRWSEKEGCRFFVRVFDVTLPHEKNIYKFHLRIIGEHFYYYEELNRPWNDYAAQ